MARRKELTDKKATPSQEQNGTAIAVSQTHFGHILDLYKHHFDLYVKSYAVYVALIGTITGIAFSEKVAVQGAKWLMFLCFVGSLFVAVSSGITRIWIRELSQDLEAMAARVNLKAPRMSGPQRTVTLLTLLSLTFAMGSFALFMMRDSTGVTVTCTDVQH